MIDEEREEELAERDRVGEKAPADDALFGGRGLSSAGYPSGRGCTCADPALSPDPRCPECVPRRAREAEAIGYGP